MEQGIKEVEFSPTTVMKHASISCNRVCSTSL